MVFCGFGCPAFVGVFVSAVGKNVKDSLRITLLFNIGRVAVYFLLAGASAYLGKVIVARLGVVPHIAFVAYMLIVGSLLFLSRTGSSCKTSDIVGWYRKMLNGHSLSAILMGILTGLIPCVPFSTVIAFSIDRASVGSAFLAAGAFGLGSSIAYMVVVGGLVGLFSSKIREKMQNKLIMQRICGAIMLIIALKDIVVLV